MSLGRDGVAGLILLAISLALFVQSFSLPYLPLVPVGPGFYPRIVLGFLALASAALVIQDWQEAPALRRRRRRPPQLSARPPAVRHRRRLRPPAAAHRLPDRDRALRRRRAGGARSAPEPRANGRCSRVALATTAVTYLMFESYLLVLLPRGTWTGW